MFDVRTILLPFDFSPNSRAAVVHGFELARQLGATVEVLHVIPHGAVEYSAFDTAKHRDECVPPDKDIYQYLDEQVAALAPSDGREPWHRTVLTGDPASCIVERAGEIPGPLVVMPTRGFGKVRRFILGSVTAKVLHDFEGPVLTGRHTDEAGVFGAANYRKIACALDLREDSRATLEWAWGLAQACKAELEILHIVSWLEHSPLSTEHFTEKLREALLSATEREVRELMASVGCDAKLTVDLGSPLELLPQAVEEAGADVLVIGRGRDLGRIGRLWSHAYGLIRRSPVPVVSV
jgi:nucleotide-binding universal stress UspA family protein